jgi:RNA polymerase subunit RPABC4/transcription elongation factor Spt4
LETNAEECPHCFAQLEKDKANIEKKQSEDIKSTNDSNSKKSAKKDTNTRKEKEKMNPDDVLMFCRACWKLISTDVECCPHCGESYKR